MRARDSRHDGPFKGGDPDAWDEGYRTGWMVGYRRAPAMKASERPGGPASSWSYGYTSGHGDGAAEAAGRWAGVQGSGPVTP